MNIFLNGSPVALPPACTVRMLLERESMGDRRVAVEVNGTIIPKGAHATCRLSEGDRVEIVHALGGG